MGGRGASSGSYKLYGRDLTYGAEYTGLFEHGNIKFVVGAMRETEKTAPRETMTEGRVYAFVSKKGGEPIAIVYFDKANKRYKQIDLKDHDGMGWHVQEGYNHEGEHRKLSKSEMRMARTVMALWRARRKDFQN